MTDLPLHAYQERIIDWMLARQDGYLAVDMGLGKTRCVLEYLKRTGKRALIVAPLQVALHTWPREIAKWAPELDYRVVHGMYKHEQYVSNAQVLIINYDGIKWLATNSRHALKNRCLILDEATAVKSHRAIRTKLLAGFRVHFDECFCMSATPTPQGVMDLWGQFRVMDGGTRLGKTWTPFSKKYFDEGYTHNLVPKAGAQAEIMNLVSDSILRLDSDDYLELPPFVDNDVVLTLSQPLQDHYNQFKREMALYIGEGPEPEVNPEDELSPDDFIQASSQAILSCKLRQFIQGSVYKEGRVAHEVHNSKLVAFDEVHTSLGGEPHMVVIAFKFELDALRSRYGNIPVIAGETSTADRTAYLDKWNAGKIPLMAIHPAAVSHGVNLQDGGHYLTWMALPWSLEHYVQVNGRLRRQGQTKPVVLTRILLDHTIDMRLAKALNTKQMTQTEIYRLIREYLAG